MKYSLRSLMQFSIRDVLWLITVAALVLALIYTKRPLSASAPTLPAPAPVGRYQLMSDPKSGLVLLDSATGRTWRYYSTEKVWEDTKSPAVIEK